MKSKKARKPFFHMKSVGNFIRFTNEIQRDYANNPHENYFQEISP